MTQIHKMNGSGNRLEAIRTNDEGSVDHSSSSSSSSSGPPLDLEFDENTVSVLEEEIDRSFWTRLIDFEDHLEDPSKDWTNSSLSSS